MLNVESQRTQKRQRYRTNDALLRTNQSARPRLQNDLVRLVGRQTLVRQHDAVADADLRLDLDTRTYCRRCHRVSVRTAASLPWRGGMRTKDSDATHSQRRVDVGAAFDAAPASDLAVLGQNAVHDTGAVLDLAVVKDDRMLDANALSDLDVTSNRDVRANLPDVHGQCQPTNGFLACHRVGYHTRAVG